MRYEFIYQIDGCVEQSMEVVVEHSNTVVSSFWYNLEFKIGEFFEYCDGTDGMRNCYLKGDEKLYISIKNFHRI